MTDLTDYLADFELTTLVRPIVLASGAGGREPLWFEGGDERGLAIIVSVLDAEIYRRFAIASGSSVPGIVSFRAMRRQRIMTGACMRQIPGADISSRQNCVKRHTFTKRRKTSAGRWLVAEARLWIARQK